MQSETEKTPFGQGDASYRAAGGFEGLVDLVERFYGHMDELPVAARIRAMHPPDLTTSKDKLARFLAGWLGGPRLFDETYGPISIPMFHHHLDVREDGRDAWLACMQAALAETDHDPAFKRYLMSALAIPAERIRIVAER
ncbi:MAG: group II truncated hemoglobin [Planctomycetota bacterium]|nr:group II truncated hemoglobin [Planctomycetota bacterium]